KGRHDWRLLVAVVPSVLLLAVQLAIAEGWTGGMGLAPGQVWSSKTSSIMLSVIIVTAFPVVALAVSRSSWQWSGLWVGVGTWVVGLLQRVMLIEPARPGHGNWGWGYFISLKV